MTSLGRADRSYESEADHSRDDMAPGLGNGGRGEAGTATFRLSLMMFLQYAVWGAWLPLAALYLQAPRADGGLGFTHGQIGWIIGLGGSIGAICAPFIA